MKNVLNFNSFCFHVFFMTKKQYSNSPILHNILAFCFFFYILYFSKLLSRLLNFLRFPSKYFLIILLKYFLNLKLKISSTFSKKSTLLKYIDIRHSRHIFSNDLKANGIFENLLSSVNSVPGKDSKFLERLISI